VQATVHLLLAAAAVVLPVFATAAATRNIVDPVRVDYYMEALCP
jgi:hypothetical protein